MLYEVITLLAARRIEQPDAVLRAVLLERAHHRLGEIDLDRARIRVDRVTEYTQMFREAWRIERDWFYDLV